MDIFEEDMNVEAQLQVAFSTIAELRDQIDVLNKMNWSLEERLVRGHFSAWCDAIV